MTSRWCLKWLCLDLRWLWRQSWQPRSSTGAAKPKLGGKMIFDLLYFKHCPPFHLSNFNNKKIWILVYICFVESYFEGLHCKPYTGLECDIIQQAINIYREISLEMHVCFPEKIFNVFILSILVLYFSVWYSYWTSITKFHLLLLQFCLSPKLHDRGASERLEL